MSKFNNLFKKSEERLSKVVIIKDGVSTEVDYIPAVIVKKKKKKLKKTKRQIDKEFFESKRWQRLRARVFKKYGRLCLKCGETRGFIQVDHVKPRSKFPDLQWIFSNLQPLCIKCNTDKSNKSCSDYR